MENNRQTKREKEVLDLLGKLTVQQEYVIKVAIGRPAQG